MPSLARAERAALLDLLTELGPDAGTLCEGWRTADLARHLVVRERQPLSIPGYASPRLSFLSERFERAARGRAHEDVLARLRSGPPLWSPVGSPVDAVYDATNLHEFYVHHEDVRRLVDPEPRELGRELEQALWSRLRLLGPVLARRARVGVELVTPGAQSLVLRRGADPVLVRGRVGELFLWLFGRDVARVELDGPVGAVQQLRATRIGP